MTKLFEQSEFLQGRSVERLYQFTANDAQLSETVTSLRSLKTTGNATVDIDGGLLIAGFCGAGSTHQVTLMLPNRLIANGLYAKLRLGAWKNIKYLAFGYTHDGEFRHIKVVNPAQDQWITVSLQHGDIGYGLQNGWAHPDSCEISDVRIYLRAETFESGSKLVLDHVACWHEVQAPIQRLATCALPLIDALPKQNSVSTELLDVIYDYLRKCFRHVTKLAEAFMQSGLCPLYGETQLDWQLDQALPDNLSAVGTYAFSWHSLHPASILMVYAKNTGADAPVFAAREMLTNWLERSYYTPDPDKKYAWYDHGTAERQIAFILMWAEGVERGFDRRFMSRLGGAIIRHAELLESEQFYASHQPTRYHNHAWFQDLALMATALAIPDSPASQRWMQRAIERLSDQLETLIVRDNGFSVFVENSIGYHQGVQRIVELAGDMVRLTGVESPIPDVAVELSRFSEFFRYPDNRAPAQGDTFRRSNPQGDSIKKLKPYPKPDVVILPKAGYGIVKGNHDGVRFMFCMFATSLCRTHKHEDDLSFTLFLDGIEWLIDPSFYSHEYKSAISAYLRSAAAHNTIYIKDSDYSIDPGRSKIDGETDGDKFYFDGSSTAYRGVTVKRKVKGFSSKLLLEFTDQVMPEDIALDARLMLHCGEGVKAHQKGQMLILSHADSDYLIKIQFPFSQLGIEQGAIGKDQVRGISGTAFMSHTEINTIECLVPNHIPINWTIAAEKI